jgi:large subunit ribosomal protein L9
MANTEVLLLRPIDGLGGEGDQVKVRAGYARNYLLPEKWALPINRANRKHIESLQAGRKKREAQELAHAQELAGKLEKVSIAIAVKTGEGGKMFGSVTSQDIIDRLKEEGIQVEKRVLQLAHPIKTLGKHTVKVKLHESLAVELDLEVVSENPIDVDVLAE